MWNISICRNVLRLTFLARFFTVFCFEVKHVIRQIRRFASYLQYSVFFCLLFFRALLLFLLTIWSPIQHPMVVMVCSMRLEYPGNLLNLSFSDFYCFYWVWPFIFFLSSLANNHSTPIMARHINASLVLLLFVLREFICVVVSVVISLWEIQTLFSWSVTRIGLFTEPNHKTNFSTRIQLPGKSSAHYSHEVGNILVFSLNVLEALHRTACSYHEHG